ncbi:GntR family transcriptional regulator [Actinomycetospora sp. TBRC 11914]|uniref:GntR family transcriptional regulator n=1 Tax=Actinomycetospora sp. TBRC 11914 TaxID=2729387 RepID=UPI00145EC2CA|nr:GntR family transcriptional regulator [Actinomycetospora sp. TBRC 11914]NMO93140.1 GntR family transcriptional regulator [Actinomycetospora sp. TBRC 11914]
MTGAASTSSAGDTAHERLLEELTSGALLPGSPVLETAVAARYGLGRAPVREAILRLECDGLIVRGARGPVVRTLTPSEVVDIYQARIALEAEAAASAARHRSSLDLARLQHVHEQSRAATDPEEARRLHGRWHQVLRRSSRNDTITEVLEQLARRLALHDTGDMTRSANLESTDDEHQVVLDAIVAGDEDTARKALREHLERTRDVRIAALVRDEGGVGAFGS